MTESRAFSSASELAAALESGALDIEIRRTTVSGCCMATPHSTTGSSPAPSTWCCTA
jgi:hypothetical protein